ncbi:hypothetical protein ACJRPK_12000 [Aquimarina sp. 2-A2]|uniref:hypothetical protein n=1 Tax=Aquimarina sp. 2-A2 TaxID=3382644 RepID=UPI00387F340D
MKNNIKTIRLFFGLIAGLLILATSCSEGDLITDELEFEGTLSNCANTSANTFVFYKLDATKSKALFLNFTGTNFTLIPDTKKLTSTDVVTLNETTNLLTYREFNSPITASSYFCSNIPPKENTTTLEYVSTSGTAEISYDFLRIEANDSIFSRSIILKDVTLTGNEIAYRKEFLALGEQEVAKPFTP